MYKLFFRPILFLFSPETAHQIVFFLLKSILKIPNVSCLLKRIFFLSDPRLERRFCGLTFKNPVGLAAGFDKNAEAVEALSCFGFGFIEIGTVTPRPQEGNPKQRLFRLPEDEGLINRMGFNNVGVEQVLKNLKSSKRTVLIGGNIGKQKETQNEKAFVDYQKCFEVLFPVVDYFVVNVSSPNTPGLRELQGKEILKNLLEQLQGLNRKKESPKPIFLKIAPDLTDGQLEDVVSVVHETGIQGVVATNTTISRDRLKTKKDQIQEIGAGGLSGPPLKARATEVIRFLRQRLKKEIIIIGVGGIHSAEDALEKIEAGADLVQVYTGLVYEGPRLVKEINRVLMGL